MPDHPVVVATFEPYAMRVASLVEEPKNSSVLEVGCGNGFLTFALEKHFGEVACLDYSRQMLDVNPCRNKILGLSTNLSFKDNSFDIVVESHLLHHLLEKDRFSTLEEMARVARVAVVLFEPNRNNPLMFFFLLLQKEERMGIRFSRSYIRSLVKHLNPITSEIHVLGLIVPNKSPIWWLSITKFLEKTPVQRLGFNIYCVLKLPVKEGIR